MVVTVAFPLALCSEPIHGESAYGHATVAAPNILLLPRCSVTKVITEMEKVCLTPLAVCCTLGTEWAQEQSDWTGLSLYIHH